MLHTTQGERKGPSEQTQLACPSVPKSQEFNRRPLQEDCSLPEKACFFEQQGFIPYPPEHCPRMVGSDQPGISILEIVSLPEMDRPSCVRTAHVLGRAMTGSGDTVATSWTTNQYSECSGMFGVCFCLLLRPQTWPS